MPDGLVADSFVLMAYSVSALTMSILHMNSFNRSFKTLLFPAVMVLLLAACGQRGPLYLPAPEQEPARTSETEAGETGENEAGDDDEKSPGEKTLRPGTE